MASFYQVPAASVNMLAVPVSGRNLAHAPADLVARAFTAADLVLGTKQLVRPTASQAASLSRVNATYVHWALRRMDERAAIEAGFIPLVPARPVVPRTNGQSVSPALDVDETTLIDIARVVGSERMLAAAVAAEGQPAPALTLF